ncbi:MAG TPA: cytochrome c [Gallionella sp.]|nr:cytochrome c [Gallionella sp.]
MRLITAFALLCSATAAVANPFPNGDAQTGQKLFDQYKCARCHASMLGGDGSAIFTRADRKVHNAAQLVEQMGMCTGNLGITLTPQDEQHLGAYLNRYYKLK